MYGQPSSVAQTGTSGELMMLELARNQAPTSGWFKRMGTQPTLPCWLRGFHERPPERHTPRDTVTPHCARPGPA